MLHTLLAPFTGLLACLAITTAHASEPRTHNLPTVSPETVGLSAERLESVTAAIQTHINNGDIAGAVGAVMRDGQLVYTMAAGYRDLGDASPMGFDTLFRTYSMTRPITALGIIMLHEDGLLDVYDPVQKHLPQFAGQQVLLDPTSTNADATRARNGDITLAQLLTHTSGIGSRNSALYRAHNVHSYDQTLEQVVNNVAALPLFEDPGTRFRYGMHSEILGRVIEVVSGQSLMDFYQARIFDPLGMTDTVFHVDNNRRDRLSTVYRPDGNGRLQAHSMEHIAVTDARALTSAGVGLVSSTEDFLRFSQLFLDGGMAGDQRLISAEGMRMAAENAIPEALMPIGGGGSGYWAGSGWTLGGFAVALDPSTYGHPVNQGEFWWDGSTGTRFWIDPQENMVTIIMAAVNPASGNGFRERFKTLVYEAIDDSRVSD